MFKFFLVVLLALATINMASAAYLKCDTTEGSPFKSDVEAAIRQIKRRTFCCQDSPSSCNDLVKRERTAALSLCGSAANPFATCVPCTIVASHYWAIVDGCTWKDPKVNRERVGGWVHHDSPKPEYRVFIYNSNKRLDLIGDAWGGSVAGEE